MEIRVQEVRLVSGESPTKAEVWEMAAAIPGSEVIETFECPIYPLGEKVPALEVTRRGRYLVMFLGD